MLRTQSSRCVLLASLVLAAAACGKPLFWIGELGADGGTATQLDANVRSAEAGSSPTSGDAAPTREAGSPTDGAAVEREAGAAPPDTAEPPRADEPGADPSLASDEDEDAGVAPIRPEVPTKLPVATAPCPTLSGPGTYTFGTAKRTLSARVFIAPDARSKPPPGGPLIMYWHAMTSSANEVLDGLGQAAIDEVVAQGGVVASFNSRLCTDCGLLADDVVWYVEDDIASDHLVACALEQARVDPRRIHAIGHSAGAMRTLHLGLVRSDFIASVVSYSGGDRLAGQGAIQDPANKLASIVLYGGRRDNLGLDYRDLARQWYDSRTALGSYTMVCDHGGGHVIPAEFGRYAYQFFKDHPYKVSPGPYAAAVPSDFPEYCTNEFPDR